MSLIPSPPTTLRVAPASTSTSLSSSSSSASSSMFGGSRVLSSLITVAPTLPPASFTPSFAASNYVPPASPTAARSFSKEGKMNGTFGGNNSNNSNVPSGSTVISTNTSLPYPPSPAAGNREISSSSSSSSSSDSSSDPAWISFNYPVPRYPEGISGERGITILDRSSSDAALFLIDDSLTELQRIVRYVQSTLPLQRALYTKRIASCGKQLGVKDSLDYLIPLLSALCQDSDASVRHAVMSQIALLAPFVMDEKKQRDAEAMLRKDSISRKPEPMRGGLGGNEFGFRTSSISTSTPPSHISSLSLAASSSSPALALDPTCVCRICAATIGSCLSCLPSSISPSCTSCALCPCLAIPPHSHALYDSSHPSAEFAIQFFASSSATASLAATLSSSTSSTSPSFLSLSPLTFSSVSSVQSSSPFASLTFLPDDDEESYRQIYPHHQHWKALADRRKKDDDKRRIKEQKLVAQKKKLESTENAIGGNDKQKNNSKEKDEAEKRNRMEIETNNANIVGTKPNGLMSNSAPSSASSALSSSTSSLAFTSSALLSTNSLNSSTSAFTSPPKHGHSSSFTPSTLMAATPPPSHHSHSHASSSSTTMTPSTVSMISPSPFKSPDSPIPSSLGGDLARSSLWFVCYSAVTDVLFPCAWSLIHDSSAEVRLASVEALVAIAAVLQEKDVGDLLLCRVLTLAHEEQEDHRTTAATLMQALAKALGYDFCRSYIVHELAAFSDDASFRVRKATAQAVGSVVAVVGEAFAVAKVLPFYLRLSKDQIWGVRKSALESLLMITKTITSGQVRNEMLIPMLQRCLNDSSRWVRNSAYELLGPFIFLLGRENLSMELLQSFANIPRLTTDRVDLDVHFHCAFAFPAVVSAVGEKYWPVLADTLQVLARNQKLAVRRCISSSLHELAATLPPYYAEAHLLSVFEHFMSDVEEVKGAAIRHFARIFSKLDLDENHKKLSKYLRLLSEIATQKKQWRWRKMLAKQMSDFCFLFDQRTTVQKIFPIILELCKDPIFVVRAAAAHAVGSILCRLHTDKDYDQIKEKTASKAASRQKKSKTTESNANANAANDSTSPPPAALQSASPDSSENASSPEPEADSKVDIQSSDSEMSEGDRMNTEANTSGSAASSASASTSGAAVPGDNSPVSPVLKSRSFSEEDHSATIEPQIFSIPLFSSITEAYDYAVAQITDYAKSSNHFDRSLFLRMCISVALRLPFDVFQSVCFPLMKKLMKDAHSNVRITAAKVLCGLCMPAAPASYSCIHLHTQKQFNAFPDERAYTHPHPDLCTHPQSAIHSHPQGGLSVGRVCCPCLSKFLRQKKEIEEMVLILANDSNADVLHVIEPLLPFFPAFAAKKAKSLKDQVLAEESELEDILGRPLERPQDKERDVQQHDDEEKRNDLEEQLSERKEQCSSHQDKKAREHDRVNAPTAVSGSNAMDVESPSSSSSSPATSSPSI